MKKNHGVFIGFAVLLLAAIFIVAGCGGKKNSGGSGGDADAAGAVGQAAKAVKGLKESPASDFSYDATSDGKGVVITKYTGDGGKVVIPAQIEGLPVVEIGQSAFIGENNYNLGPGYNLTSVVIPAGVTEIGGFAFQHCEKLTSVTIQGSGVKLTGDAFTNCTELSEIVIPDGEKALIPGDYYGAGAFRGCKKLSLAMRAKLKEMGFDNP